MKTLSYKDVLTCKAWLGDIAKMYDYAVALGYPYFLWNDRVYQVMIGERNVTDTGLTVENVL